MQIAPRTVATALAAAAIAVTSLLQPAQPAEAASSGPDLAVVFEKMDGPLYENGLQGARFAYRNIGPAASGEILAVRVCGYWKFQEKNGNWSVVHYEKQMPLLTLPARVQAQGGSLLIQCPRDEGLAPEKVTLKLAAQVGEIDTSNNTASQILPGARTR